MALNYTKIISLVKAQYSSGQFFPVAASDFLNERQTSKSGWKFEDGPDVQASTWRHSSPDNRHGNQDCVEYDLRKNGLNDLNCATIYKDYNPLICEWRQSWYDDAVGVAAIFTMDSDIQQIKNSDQDPLNFVETWAQSKIVCAFK